MKSYEELQEENRILRQRLAKCQSGNDFPDADTNSKAAEQMSSGVKNHDLYEKGSYRSFVLGNLRSSVFYRMYHRASRFFKPAMLMVRIIRGLLLFFTLIQVSVVLLVVTAISLIMLPVVLVIFLITYFIMLHERRSLAPAMRAAIKGRRVLVFFSSATRSEFFDYNMRALSKRYTVIVVQDGGGMFGYDGVDERGQKRRFLTAKYTGERYYRVRQNYYFHLKKHYFKDAEMVAVIY